MPKNKWLQELDEIDNEGMSSPDEEQLSVQEGFWDRDKKLLLCGAGGGFVLGLFLFLVISFLIGGPENNTLGPQAAGLNQRLDKLEKRLADLGKGQTVMQESFSKLFKSTRALEKSLGQLDNSLADLQSQGSPAAENKDLPSQAKNGAESEDKPEAKQKEPQKRTHEVKEGENLYRISLKYGMSVSKLRSLNELGPEDAIYPGQELVIGKAEKQD